MRAVYFRWSNSQDCRRCRRERFLLYAEMDWLNENMSDPKNLQEPLKQLLRSIEEHDMQQASTEARALIEDLDKPSSMPDPRGGERRQVPVPFSGLFQAILREVRLADQLLNAGNWDRSAKVIREALEMLPF